MRIALGLAAAAVAFATAPAAHAGCVDDYLNGPDYLAPRQETVTYSGGVVTINPHAAPGDADEVAAFTVFFATNEAGRVVVLVDCVK